MLKTYLENDDTNRSKSCNIARYFRSSLSTMDSLNWKKKYGSYVIKTKDVIFAIQFYKIYIMSKHVLLLLLIPKKTIKNKNNYRKQIKIKFCGLKFYNCTEQKCLIFFCLPTPFKFFCIHIHIFSRMYNNIQSYVVYNFTKYYYFLGKNS